jgi:phospholipase/carboxylesterase
LKNQLIYELRKPKNVVPGKRYPALFVMHGIGSNEHNMLSLVEGLDDHFFVFSVRGHLSQGMGYAYFTIEGYGKPHRKVFDEGINKLTNFIEYASEKHPLDENQLYLLGFSQGAIVSMSLGLTLGDKIKGVVALSGYIPQFVKDDYPIHVGNHLSVFISHGEYDQVLPFQWGKENVEYFTGLDIPVTFLTYPEGHTVSEKNYQDFRNWLMNDLLK